MPHKKLILICLLFTLLTAFTVPAGIIKADGKRWIINENSTLRVNGKTNINTFACEILAYNEPDTLLVTKNKTDKEIALSGNINLNIHSFDCHNALMTNDLRKTLKEKQFPILRISFLSLNKLPELALQPEAITGLVEIDLAGVRKRFEVNYKISIDGQKMIHLLGSRDINFSDFNLVPPKKLGGIIRTEDRLSVDFHLKIKPID